MKKYTVRYRTESGSPDEEITVIANNSAEAYDKAVYNELKVFPYAAFVEGYETKAGKFHRFTQNIYGNAY